MRISRLHRLFSLLLGLAAAPVSAETGGGSAAAIPVVHRFGGAPVAWHESELPLADGVKVTVSRLDYLISDVRLERPDGSEVQFPDQYFLVSAAEDRTTITLTGVPPGPWKSLSFMVGLDRETNHGDPAQWPAGHALNPLENNLHWDWKGGYVFLAAEGRLSGPAGTPAAFLYHLGGDGNGARVKIPLPSAAPDLRSLRLVFNLDRLWGGVTPVRPGTENFTHSRKGDDLAPRLVRNLERCFEVERDGR